ncbi:BppU family phage baseplate upper protein [Senegalia massiliensis]|uniref:DUF2479 domain-containing protein n=1 Tax=Senegalia massiliensis TaxID=1720316 RepID=A0A845QX82_9CLOT|nr:DUF2479 domain-containing protein [Senegalia massiliensis]
MKPYKITVDVKNLSNYMTKKVEAKQNDTNSRTVQATICDDGIPLKLTGNTISFYAKKPDGTKIFNTVNILDDENGLVEFNLTTQTLAVEGEVKCELTIFDEAEGVILSTAIFNISVIETIRDDNAIESSNEFNQIIQVLNRLSEIEAHEMERISNEEARVLAEQQREQNESERITNENTRQQSENTRKDNEITRKQNETQRKSNEDTRKQNETIRENNEYVREEHESQRKVSENTRSQNENDRISNEDSRITNENQRVTDENTRKQNEDDRVSNENARKQSEAVRQEEEAQRKTYESRRRQDEQIRHQNEIARKENESQRELSEAERVANEEIRIQSEIDRQDFNPNNYVKTAEKGAIDGVAPLDSNGLVPLAHIPTSTPLKVVNTIAERNQIPNKYEGMKVHVLDASADSTVLSGWGEYVYTDTSFVKTAEGESLDLVLSWANITGKPTSFNPTAHNSRHAIGGSDPITPENIGAVNKSGTSDISGNLEFQNLKGILGKKLSGALMSLLTTGQTYDAILASPLGRTLIQGSDLTYSDGNNYHEIWHGGNFDKNSIQTYKLTSEAGKGELTEDCNNEINSGLYYANAATLNSPYTYGILTVKQRTDSHIMQNFVDTIDREWSRVSQDGGATWLPWQSILKVKEAGKNANGQYIRYNNGIQFCWHLKNDVSVTSTPRTEVIDGYWTDVPWIYPASFIEKPSVLSSCFVYKDTAARVFSSVKTNYVDTIESDMRIWATNDFNRISEAYFFAIGRWSY